MVREREKLEPVCLFYPPVVYPPRPGSSFHLGCKFLVSGNIPSSYLPCRGNSQVRFFSTLKHA